MKDYVRSSLFGPLLLLGGFDWYHDVLRYKPTSGDHVRRVYHVLIAKEFFQLALYDAFSRSLSLVCFVPFEFSNFYNFRFLASREVDV